MKQLKKLLTLSLALAFTLALAACGAGTAPSPDSSDPVEPWKAELLSQGKLVVGMCTDYPPYESLNTKGEIEGFDVDMAKKLAAFLGLELEIKQLGFQEIVTAVQLGQVDIGISAFSYKEDRDVLFSMSYLDNHQVIVVAKESGYTNFEELAGKKIGAGTGTSCETAAMAAIPTGQFSSPGDYTIMFAALENGALDAVACSHQVAKNYTQANDKLVTIDQIMATDGTHVIAQKGHDLLLEKVNEAVAAFIASSDYQDFADKWDITL